MKSDTQPHESIREYLLGESSSEDAALVEERLLADEDFYQELLIVEDELVDQYLAGLLADSEKEPFEKHFLATIERREKLRFARTLKRYVYAEADRASLIGKTDAIAVPTLPRRKFWRWSSPVFSYSFAAAVVIVLLVATVLIIRNLNAPPKGPDKVLAVELTPGLSRGEEGAKRISLAPDTTTVKLLLRVPNTATYQAYRAVLQTTEGREISRRDDLHRDSSPNDGIIFPIRANLLSPGDYNVKVAGLSQPGEYEDLARYYFRVNK